MAEHEVPDQGHQQPRIKMPLIQNMLKFFKSIITRLTGRRYSNIPHLWHKGVINVFAGELLENLAADGSLKILYQAAPIAFQDPSGMCYWWLGNHCCILITKVSDLKAYQKFHDTGYVSRNVPGVSKIVPHAILFNEKEEWRVKRDSYNDHVYRPENPLYVRQLIDDRIQTLTRQKKQPIDMQDFIYETLLFMVEDLFMRSNPSSQELERAKQFTLKVTTEGFDFQNIFKWILPPGMRKFIRKHPHLLHTLLPAVLYEIFYNKHQTQFNFKNFKNELKQEFVEVFLKDHQCPHNLLHELTTLAKQHNAKKDLSEADYAFDDGVILLLAGVETTTSSLLFAIKLLSQHPKVVNQLRSELKKIPPLNETADEAATKQWITTINNIPYLDGILKEVLRLYPPTPVIIPRPITQPFALGEGASQIQTAKGDFVIVSPWVLGRNPEIWQDPEAFKPERWNHENLTTEQKHAFVTFGFGHHLCIGKTFAENTAKIFLTTLFGQYDVHLEPENGGNEVSLQQGSLKPSKPLKARINPAVF